MPTSTLSGEAEWPQVAGAVIEAEKLPVKRLLDDEGEPMDEDKKRKIMPVLLGVVAAIIAGVVVRESVRSSLSSNEDIRSQRVLSEDIRSQRILNKVASEINKNLPMMVDKETELLATVGLEGIIVYNYRLINLSVTDVEPARFISAIRPQVVTAACTTPQTRDTFLKQGVTMRYSYADKERRHMGATEVKPADCGF